MAKPANKPDPAGDQVFDVAISSLIADEKVASAIKSKLSGLKVFFCAHNQEELIGTNGIGSMRAPFESARVNVVLYREPYGKTPWTGAEFAAIQDSCLKTGFRSLLFVQLDKNDPKPAWLPDTHIRCVLGDFTIEQLVGAIKNKVQELGGVIRRPDARSEAKRVKRETENLTERDEMTRDRAWIERTVHRSLHEAFQKVKKLVAQLNKDTGFQIICGATGYQSCVMRSEFVSLGCGWQQPIFSNVGADPYGDWYLRIAEVSGDLPIPGERAWVIYKPQVLKERRIKIGVNENRELVWLDGQEQIEPERLANYIVTVLMDLISSANQGKVEKPRF